MLETMPKLTNVCTKSMQRVYFHDFCPVSNNPKEGSYVEFEYYTIGEGDVFLEVYALQEFIKSFEGGKYVTTVCPVTGANKKGFVRDMEQLIEQFHMKVSETLAGNKEPGVTTRANLILDCGEIHLEIK